jgi:hypothetical protein
MFFLSYHLKQINYTKLNTVFVPDMGAGRCLGPEGNGAILGKGGEGGGPSPPGSKEDKQSVLSEGGGNIEKEEEGRTSWA